MAYFALVLKFSSFAIFAFLDWIICNGSKTFKNVQQAPSKLKDSEAIMLNQRQENLNMRKIILVLAFSPCSMAFAGGGTMPTFPGQQCHWQDHINSDGSGGWVCASSKRERLPIPPIAQARKKIEAPLDPQSYQESVRSLAVSRANKFAPTMHLIVRQSDKTRVGFGSMFPGKSAEFIVQTQVTQELDALGSGNIRNIACKGTIKISKVANPIPIGPYEVLYSDQSDEQIIAENNLVCRKF